MITASLSMVALPLLSLGSAMLAPAAIVAPLQPGFHPVELRVVEMTNAQRIRYGLPPLRVDASLMVSARRHAAWMTRSQSLQHTRQAVGENIAWGQHSARQVVRDWMQSPGHRANILSGRYRRIGAAAYVTPQGSIYWCQQFLP